MVGKPVAKVVKTSNRGSAPGERRGGRKPGTPNKATASIRDIAREYTGDAVKALVDVLNDVQQPASARVSAASAILDRGFGRPTQSMELTGAEGGPVEQLIDLKGAPTEVLKFLASQHDNDQR